MILNQMVNDPDEPVMTWRNYILFVIVDDDNEDDNDKNAHHFEKICYVRETVP